MSVWSTSERLTFARSETGRFQISATALAEIRKYVQDERDKAEAGGVLLGRHIIDTSDIVVDRVTVPMPGDSGSRFRFFRARRRHQAAIDQAWRESEGTSTYLGEWHTHPEECPTPSLINQFDWRRKLWNDQFSEPIFFVIVGIMETCVWEGYRRGRLIQLRQI